MVFRTLYLVDRIMYPVDNMIYPVYRDSRPVFRIRFPEAPPPSPQTSESRWGAPPIEGRLRVTRREGHPPDEAGLTTNEAVLTAFGAA